MIATRYLHRSDARLNVGDELMSPAALSVNAEGVLSDPRSYANWPEYCDGQHANVYFSMTGSRADELTYTYYNRKFTYVVEPLGPVEPDPEDQLQGGRGPSGSLRCPRAKIVEAHVNGFIGPRLKGGYTHRPPIVVDRHDEIKSNGILNVEFKIDKPAFKGWQDNYIKQCMKIAAAFPGGE